MNKAFHRQPRSLFRARFFSALVLLLLSLPAAAQEENRVVTRDFDWKIFSTPHFDIHYYAGSGPWVPYASGVLEAAYKREAADLAPALDKHIPFFLYASLNDMEQTGIADISDGVGGVTEPYKDRFMVWSDGSKGWLKDVIEHEFAHEAEFSVLIDGFWKSARILKTYIYPLWMMEGMAEYETGLSDYAVEKMYLRDASLSGRMIPLSRLVQFGHLKPHQTTLAYKTGAHAVRFLAAQYGAEKPRQMLELFRTRYDAGSVLKQMIGADLPVFEKKFAEYTELEFLTEARDAGLQEPSIYGTALTAGSEAIPEFNVSPAPSPDGKRLAWLSTRDGHPAQVRVRDLATGRETTLEAASAGAEYLPYGRFTKPLRSLSWSPDGKKLAFSGQYNHREYIFFYEPGTGKVSRACAEGLLEMRQPVFSPDGKKVAFVGMSGAFNDIYEASAERLAGGGELKASELYRVTESTQDESSPAYSPDGGTLAWSCEVDGSSGPARALCLLARGGSPAVVSQAPGSVYDPVFSPDGSSVYFISDAGYDFDLYSYELAGGLSRRLTRSMGGIFTPAAAGDKIYFSAFRRGEMHLYSASPLNFLYEKVPAAPAPAVAPLVESSTGTLNPYKFKASTDLFFPAFLFSSPGGLFWMNYWQASDMLGNHNLALFLNYNSGSDYVSAQASYSYARYRMPLLLSASALSVDGLTDANDQDYDRRYWRRSVATAWPFDRHNRVEAALIGKDQTDDYTGLPLKVEERTRALQWSYIRDTRNGLYLTSNRGSRTELSWLSAADTAGGNLKYDVYLFKYLKYFPLSKRAAFVDMFTAGRSVGRDRRTFDYGGLGGVRGFASMNDTEEKPGVLMNNAELRLPLFRDLDYYMDFMFPDFYFKGVYARAFVDTAYGWDRASDFGGFGARKLDCSYGLGVNAHTFLLQSFQLVLSLDYAVRASDGGKIVYFYLGPLF